MIKIIGFHSRNPRSWARQVSNLRYSNPIVNASFNQISHFTIVIHNVDCFYDKIEKKNMKSYIQSIINYLRARY